MIKSLRGSPIYRSVCVLALTGLALGVMVLLRGIMEATLMIPFLAAVFLSSWLFGLWSGLLAIFLSVLSVLSLAPRGFLAAITSWDWLVRLGSFLLLSLMITWLNTSLRKSKSLLYATLSSIGDAVLATNNTGLITFINPVAEALTGWRQAEATGKRLHDVLHLVDEKSREKMQGLIERAIREDKVIGSGDHPLLISRDGTEILVEVCTAPIRDSEAELRGFILVIRDMTARKQLEEQLSLSVKMEAVSRLAGGVAGDFNNLLTIITGYSELLVTELSPSDPLRRFAEEITFAAERAAGLTRQLLSFSRGQGAQTKLVDLNAVLADTEPLLRRLIGEKNELIVLPGPGIGKVLADPAQVKEILMNLAANSRDAMPDGGKLVLETGNVDLDDGNASQRAAIKSGSYVLLAASDTGAGMDAETKSRLFEPFFTTKEQGKGSGLGLSAVYGIVKQSQGEISVYSQIGCGTIFEIYLPRVKEPVGPPDHRRKRTRAPSGSETILLVDDEEAVRKLVFAILQSSGYTVIQASDGEEGLSAYQKNASGIDLVLTDVVMPKMSGIELGQRLYDISPNLKVLYMSGYRDTHIGDANGEVARAFLNKPFTPEALLAKVREVLDSRSHSSRR